MGSRYIAYDSSGGQVGSLDWLAEIPSAGILVRNVWLSKDDSTVIGSDQGPEIFMANINGSGMTMFDPDSALVLEFEWSAGTQAATSRFRADSALRRVADRHFDAIMPG